MKTGRFKRLIPSLLALVFSVLIVQSAFAQAPVSICVLKDRNQGGVTIQDCVPVGTGSGYVSLPTASTAPVGGLQVTPTPSASVSSVAAPTAGAFSTILAADSARKGCLIQNTGTTTGYLRFAANAGSTTANSFVVPAGGSMSCTNGNVVANDNVAGTCASGTCAFVISSQ